MANTLATLVVSLHADVAGFQRDLGRAAHISEREWRKVSKSAAEVGKQIAAVGAIAGAALGKMAKDAIDSADQFSKMSQRIGISVESLSGLAHAAKLSDVSLESLSTSLRQLSKNMLDTQANTGEAKQAFAALGISVESTKGVLKSNEQVMLEIADKFEAMEDGAGKTAIAMRLFGRAGADMIPLLNQGSKGLRENADEARRFGIVLSTQLAKQAEEFNDNLTRIQQSLKGFGYSIAQDALPWLNRMVEQLLEGTRIAGGFGNALRLFGLSSITSGNAGAKIQEITAQIDRLQAARQKAIDQGRTRGGLISNFDREIADAQKQLEFAKFLQRQSALELGKAAGGDTPGERLRGAVSKLPAPALPSMDELRKAAGGNDFVLKQLIEDQEEWVRIMSEASAATDKFAQAMRDLAQSEQLMEAFGGRTPEQMKAWLDFIDSQREAEENAARLAAGFDEAGNAIKSELGEWSEFTKQAARNMQDSMSGFFFDVMQGNLSNLGDSFKRSIDKMVSDMLAAKANAFLFGENFGKTDVIGGVVGKGIDLFKGWLPSFDTGTDYVPRDMLAVVHRGEAIIPAAQNVGGRGMTVNQSFYLSGPVDRRSMSQIAVEAQNGLIRAQRDM
jgi:hypothetical protein